MTITEADLSGISTEHVASRQWKWCGIAAVGTKLYAAPYSAPKLLVFDTKTETAYGVSTASAHSGGGGKWEGIVARGTKLYAAPSNAPKLLVFDTETESVSAVSTEAVYAGSTRFPEPKWVGIAAVGERVYAAPAAATQVLPTLAIPRARTCA